MPSEPKIIWRAPLSEVALAGVAATKKFVVVADRELDDSLDAFRCFDAASGKEVWAHRYPAPGALDYGNSSRATPLIDGDAVVLFGAHGHLRSLDLATGKLRWQLDVGKRFGVTEEMPWGFCGSPLLVDRKLIINPGGPQASLVALDVESGKVLWQSPGRPASYGSLIVATLGGQRQIVGHDQTTLGGWDIETGKRLWAVEPRNTQDFNVPTPIAYDGRLIATTESNGTRLFEFDERGAIKTQPIARFDDLSPDTHSPVVVGDRLFGIWGDLYCLDLKNSLKPIYVAEDPAFRQHASLIASAERLLICCDDGQLILLNARADEYHELGRCQLFEDESGLLSHPALVGNRLYVRGSRELIGVELP